MVFTPFDRPENHEIGTPNPHDGGRWCPNVTANPARHCHGHLQILGLCELFQLIDRRLRIADDTGGGCQSIPYPITMLLGLPGPAKFGMRNGYEVVNQVDSAKRFYPNPCREAWLMKPGMTDIEIDHALQRRHAISRCHCQGECPSQRPLGNGRSPQKQGKQAIRGIRRQNNANAASLKDRIRTRAEALHVGEAHAIDAGWQPPSPRAPYQSRDVEQYGPVTSDWIVQATRIWHLPTPRGHSHSPARFTVVLARC